MKVVLLAHTRLTNKVEDNLNYSDGEAILLTALRNCYSTNNVSTIVELEKEKYFTEVNGVRDCDRLFKEVISKGHLSTLEHISFTFAIEGVTRSLLAQLTRHRVGFSYSVKSQRYIKLSTDSKSKGFKYELPSKITEEQKEIYVDFMNQAQELYDKLIASGMNAEDARMVLPNATLTDILMSCNLRSLGDLYNKRGTKFAQEEIRILVNKLVEEVIKVEPWTKWYFNNINLEIR